MYLSPLSGKNTTIFLPANSSFLATFIAAESAAPEEIPANTPSFTASSVAALKAASSKTVRTSSTNSFLKFSGTKFAPMPCILCEPATPFVMSGEVSGSTPKIFTPSTLSLRYLPTPETVPPVPMPATKAATFPSVSS